MPRPGMANSPLNVSPMAVPSTTPIPAVASIFPDRLSRSVDDSWFCTVSNAQTENANASYADQIRVLGPRST